MGRIETLRKIQTLILRELVAQTPNDNVARPHADAGSLPTQVAALSYATGTPRARGAAQLAEA